MRTKILSFLGLIVLSSCKFTNPVLPSDTDNLKKSGEFNVINANTTLGSLSVYCDVTSFSSTFYQDPDLGIGWGTFATHSTTNPDGWNPVPHQMQCCNLDSFSSISNVRVRMKTTPNPVYSETGYLYISRQFSSLDGWGDYWTALSSAHNGGVASNMDAWAGNWFGNTYQTAIFNSVTQQSLVSQTDGVAKDVTIDVPYSSPNLQICMSADTHTGGYTGYSKRYIYELTIQGTLK